MRKVALLFLFLASSATASTLWLRVEPDKALSSWGEAPGLLDGDLRTTWTSRRNDWLLFPFPETVTLKAARLHLGPMRKGTVCHFETSADGRRFQPRWSVAGPQQQDIAGHLFAERPDVRACRIRFSGPPVDLTEVEFFTDGDGFASRVPSRGPS